ncbi:hypothetical protein Micbo1qcDRAFT_178341 [Microdochium bolleyi]|uniref:Apple domain-containing protein n=1 Tax=Microdochium bolleyi TaxID=196109 RepID=A0A136ITR8_9PEZI|nr:hypothetical protein Micbo1qcDRAFT_178341 [Microdochium bolleyi]
MKFTLPTAILISLAAALPSSEPLLQDRAAGSGPCSDLPAGSYTGAMPADNSDAFKTFSTIINLAKNAATPPKTVRNFFGLEGATTGGDYITYSTLPEYNPELCLKKCKETSNCKGFNIFFERDPSKIPGSGCENPASNINIKCSLWAKEIATKDATNTGGYRAGFHVVITGSNGYTLTP